jgi:DNA-binding beta-propeller fold protein YncE
MARTYSCRSTLAANLLFLAASTGTQIAAAGSSEFYVVTKKPASLTVIDGAKPAVLATVPLDGVPFDAVLGGNHDRAYVLHGVPGLPLTVSVVDLAARKVATKIEVDANARQLSWSIDKRFLICASTGLSPQPASVPAGLFAPSLLGTVVLIDAEKNKVVAMRCPIRFAHTTLFTPDASRFFFINRAERADKKQGTPAREPSITTFAREQKEPLAEAVLPDITAAVLSPDGKWLYALDPGDPNKKPERHRDAAVAVIDVETGKIAATHAIGIQPRSLSSDLDNGVVTVIAQQGPKDTAAKLYVFHGKDAPQKIDAGEEASGLRPVGRDGTRVILARDSLRFLDKAGDVLSPAVPLNATKGADKSGEITYAGGNPGEVLPLPDRDRLVMSVVHSNGAPTGKLALVDLKQKAVLKVITSGRGSIRIAKTVLAVAEVAMAAGASARMAADPQLFTGYGGNPILANFSGLYSPPPPNMHVAAGPDGRFVYAFNAQTGDITVVATEDGATPKMIPFGNCEYIRQAPGGKFMVARNAGNVLLIKTDTHESTEHKVPGGFRSLYIFQDSPLMAAATGKGIMLWDIEKGTLVDTLATSEPVLFLEPLRPVASSTPQWH